jgi:FMN-dependent NADH-azoreductase
MRVSALTEAAARAGDFAMTLALLICARGLDYSPSAYTPADIYDFKKPYLETWLRFIGISNITTVTVEKTLFGPEVDGPA